MVFSHGNEAPYVNNIACEWRPRVVGLNITPFISCNKAPRHATWGQAAARSRSTHQRTTRAIQCKQTHQPMFAIQGPQISTQIIFRSFFPVFGNWTGRLLNIIYSKNLQLFFLHYSQIIECFFTKRGHRLNHMPIRMHSSRMRTIRCSCRRGLGVSAQGGSAGGCLTSGRYLPAGGGVCPEGCLSQWMLGYIPPYEQNHKRLWKHNLCRR